MLCSGYNPVEPSTVQERMTAIQDKFAELQALAGQRRQRLGDNKRLMQYFWDIADLEQGMKELEQVR